MMTKEISIPDAKERLTIPDLWRVLTLNGEAPTKDGVYCSPFRDDSQPSFSIFADGKRFKDHGTGEGGDAITFYGIARGIENRDAVKEFLSLAAKWK